MTRICLFFACLSLHTAFGQSMFVSLNAGLGSGSSAERVFRASSLERASGSTNPGFSLGLETGIQISQECHIGTGLAFQDYEAQRPGISDVAFSMMRIPLFVQWKPMRTERRFYPVFKLGMYGARGKLYEHFKTWPDQNIQTKPFILLAPEKHREIGVTNAIGLCWGSASGWEIGFDLQIDIALQRFGSWNNEHRNLTCFGLFSLKKNLFIRI
jgi:hypothetical protein